MKATWTYQSKISLEKDTGKPKRNGQLWKALENIAQTKPDKTKKEAFWGYPILLSYWEHELKNKDFKIVCVWGG